ncbi:UDP-N-acetylenolpyruvoylglucosamine reductase [Candidatus Peregrinibacteria bacterium CG11_big_fil_rev_8_21_14_0_20_46_8]|nr:MAG: UDP-N-acetylenolpyruvoylglucosamine reductase [Candidatus Peregrinibacteria bacterium CG11_big_fil_rev_8_21_14_0_20_46_8]
MYEKLKKSFPKIREQELLAKHSTFRVGGPADLFYELTDIEALPELVTTAEKLDIPYRIIGRGTNILFTDKGYRGLIIKNVTNGLKVQGTTIYADSGVLLAQIVQQSVKHHVTGLEPLFGLPGSIGAAVWGNAGVPQCEIGSFVKEIELYKPKDGRRTLQANEIDFRYRHTSLQEMPEIILRVQLALFQGDAQQSKEMMKLINQIRIGKQPTGYTCGSFFKNPAPDTSAGMLIDQAGLKGTKIGGAEISQKHANFFLNSENASAQNILDLKNLAQKRVKEKFKIDLEPEVKIIGEL